MWCGRGVFVCGVWCVLCGDGDGDGDGDGGDRSVDVASLSITHHSMHLIMGAVSLWTRPPVLSLCTGPQKVYPSSQ